MRFFTDSLNHRLPYSGANFTSAPTQPTPNGLAHPCSAAHVLMRYPTATSGGKKTKKHFEMNPVEVALVRFCFFSLPSTSWLRQPVKIEVVSGYSGRTFLEFPEDLSEVQGELASGLRRLPSSSAGGEFNMARGFVRLCGAGR